MRAVTGYNLVEVSRNYIAYCSAVAPAVIAMFHTRFRSIFPLFSPEPGLGSEIIASLDILHPFDRKTDRFLVELFREFDLFLEGSRKSSEDIA